MVAASGVTVSHNSMASVASKHHGQEVRTEQEMVAQREPSHTTASSDSDRRDEGVVDAALNIVISEYWSNAPHAQQQASGLEDSKEGPIGPLSSPGSADCHQGPSRLLASPGSADSHQGPSRLLSSPGSADSHQGPSRLLSSPGLADSHQGPSRLPSSPGSADSHYGPSPLLYSPGSADSCHVAAGPETAAMSHEVARKMRSLFYKDCFSDTDNEDDH